MERGISALVGIWGGVIVISLFAPDLVSGSQQEHLPIAAFGTWIWGMVASRSVFTAILGLHREGASEQLQGQLAGFVAGIWAVAALVAVFGPQLVTGSDPTRLPLAALLAPIGAAAITAGACEMASAFALGRREHCPN